MPEYFKEGDRIKLNEVFQKEAGVFSQFGTVIYAGGELLPEVDRVGVDVRIDDEPANETWSIDAEIGKEATLVE